MSYYIDCTECKKKIPKGKESKTKDGKYHCFDCVMKIFIKEYNKHRCCECKKKLPMNTTYSPLLGNYHCSYCAEKKIREFQENIVYGKKYQG